MMNLRLPTRRFLVQLWHQWQRSNLPWWSTHWEAFQKRCPLDDFWKKDMDIFEHATCSSNKSLHNVFDTLSLYYTCMYLGQGTPGMIKWLGGFLHICGQSTDGMTSLMSLCFEGMFLGAVETFFSLTGIRWVHLGVEERSIGQCCKLCSALLSQKNGGNKLLVTWLKCTRHVLHGSMTAAMAWSHVWWRHDRQLNQLKHRRHWSTVLPLQQAWIRPECETPLCPCFACLKCSPLVSLQYLVRTEREYDMQKLFQVCSCPVMVEIQFTMKHRVVSGTVAYWLRWQTVCNTI